MKEIDYGTIGRTGVHAEHYEELCYRIGRAVLAMMLGRDTWFNGIVKRHGGQDVCAFPRGLRVSKWLERIANEEHESLLRGYTDGVDCHYPKRKDATL